MTPLSFKEWMTHHPGECIEHYMGLHDSLFEAGRYDMLTDIYSGMFLYMPSDPDGNPDTLRRQLLRIMPLYNQVLSKTGAYEAAVQLLDSIRLSGHPFLTGYCAYPLWAFEAQNSLMTDDNRRTEALADSFAVLLPPDDQSVVMLCCHMVSWAYHFSSARPNVACRMQERAVEAYRRGGETQDVGAILARLGYYYRREGRYVKAVDLSLAAVEWYDKHPGIATDGMIRAYADLAALYSTLALTEKALEINARVIRMAAREDSMALCGAYRVRSSFFMDLEQVDSAAFYLGKEREVAQRMGERSLKTWRRDRAKYWLQMCPDSNAAALRDMEAIFADSAGVRPATHSGTRYWLGLALVRDGQEERGLAMMEQAHREFAYMDWDEMEAFAAKGLLGIYASRHLGSRMLEFYPRYAALQDSLNEKDKLRYTTGPDVQPAVHTESGTQVPKHEIFSHHGVRLRIKSGNVLQTRRYVPPPSRETGSDIKFMFRSGDDRILHVKVTVISVYRPVAVDTVGSLYFYTRILYLSGVLVQHTTSVRIRQRLDKVLSVNKEQIDAIL